VNHSVYNIFIVHYNDDKLIYIKPDKQTHSSWNTFGLFDSSIRNSQIQRGSIAFGITVWLLNYTQNGEVLTDNRVYLSSKFRNYLLY